MYLFLIFLYAPVSIKWEGQEGSYTFRCTLQGKMLAIRLILLRNLPTLARRSWKDIWHFFHFFIFLFGLLDRTFFFLFLRVFSYCLVILKYSVCYFFFSSFGFPLVLNFIRFFIRKNNANYVSILYRLLLLYWSVRAWLTKGGFLYWMDWIRWIRFLPVLNPILITTHVM